MGVAVAEKGSVVDDGLLVVGTHAGVEPQLRKDKTPVAGRYELIVEVNRGEFTKRFRCRFPELDQDGEQSLFARRLESFKGSVGSRIAVRVSISTRVYNNQAYYDLNAVDIQLLA